MIVLNVLHSARRKLSMKLQPHLPVPPFPHAFFPFLMPSFPSPPLSFLFTPPSSFISSLPTTPSTIPLLSFPFSHPSFPSPFPALPFPCPPPLSYLEKC